MRLNFALFASLSLILSLISSVGAQTPAPAPGGSSGMMNIVGIVLMFGVFFFLIILPQTRKAKKQAQFLAQLKKGDAVITQGGLYGKISGLTDKVVTLEIATKVFVRVDRQSISGTDPFATASSTSSLESVAS